VTVLDSLTYSGNRQNLKLAPVGADTQLAFVEGDIVDAALAEEVMPNHDAVAHFAAESHVDRSILNAEPFVTASVLWHS